MARLNVQGLARRDRGLMGCLSASPGKTLVSIDLAAGEPVCTAHFSKDQKYKYATFDGIGKAPFYQDSVLMISDIYLMTMSVSPIGRKEMLEAFNATYSGLSFAEMWLKDDEFLKGQLKKARTLHKMLCLALGYGMGPKKMVKQCYDNGYTLELSVAREFYKAYWVLFSGVRKLADALSNRIKRDGHLINPFGYRLTPPPHKALNYFIQSSVSGLIHVFNAKLFALAPYADLITIIHDEDLVEVPDERLEEFKCAKETATVSLNEDLGWSTTVRTGFVTGKNWYEAK